jgi:predicted enzyme related to lactoylglutathione lyase
MSLKITMTSIPVDDQEKALRFYTEVLGFEKRVDMPAGEYRWLTVGEPNKADGTQLLLEPMAMPAAREYQQALFTANVPAAMFGVEDIAKEAERLEKAGVVFRVKPQKEAWGSYAVFEDTCGNLINISEIKGASS